MGQKIEEMYAKDRCRAWNRIFGWIQESVGFTKVSGWREHLDSILIVGCSPYHGEEGVQIKAEGGLDSMGIPKQIRVVGGSLGTSCGVGTIRSEASEDRLGLSCQADMCRGLGLSCVQVSKRLKEGRDV